MLTIFSPHLAALSDGSSRGFAIAKFDREENAQKAIADLNGKLIDGRKTEVRHDLGLETLKGKQKNIYVSQLPTESTEEEIKEVFGRIGTVESINLQKSSKTGVVWAILQYATAEEAILAVDTLHHTKFGHDSGTEIIVRLDRKVSKPLKK